MNSEDEYNRLIQLNKIRLIIIRIFTISVLMIMLAIVLFDSYDQKGFINEHLSFLLGFDYVLIFFVSLLTLICSAIAFLLVGAKINHLENKK